MTVEKVQSDVPPTLLAGPSARELAGRFLRALGLAVVGGIVIASGPLVGSASGRTTEGFVIFVGLVICVVFGVRAFLVTGPLQDAVAREAAAGYTTMPGSRRGRWRLDYRTGAVIAPPEEPKGRQRP